MIDVARPPRQRIKMRAPRIDPADLWHLATLPGRLMLPTTRPLARQQVGPRPFIRIAPTGMVDIGESFRARGDLTLVVSGKLKIGSLCFLNRGCHIVAFEQVSIGDRFRAGEHVSIHDENHLMEPLSDLDGRYTDYLTAAVQIGDRVLVGANTLILAGTIIGDDCVVGAGSIVKGTFPAGTLIAGSPARVIRELKP